MQKMAFYIVTINWLLPRAIYGKTVKGVVNIFFDLSNRQLMNTKNQIETSFIYRSGDDLSGKITHVEQLSPEV